MYKLVRPIKGFPALLIDKKLIIADLHLGYEYELERHGIKLPPRIKYFTSLLQKLHSELLFDTIIILGDIKHHVVGISDLEWQIVPSFLNTLLDMNVSITIVPGNHDGNLLNLTPSNVEIKNVRGFQINKIWLLHGHALPPEEARSSKLIVMAHLHPLIEFIDEFGFKTSLPVWVYLRGHPSLLVMPAFNPFVGGLVINKNLKEEYIGPLFRWLKLDMKAAELYSLDLSFLGPLSFFLI
ncbi:hypothetical protein B6U74_00450 [Candidatus Bathyarchaeota archaeon ex4484_205]|nr:MAG: hypothetical protein B6U74_00450 [Candidatus Bathyarchaeota archaeon ex4484_205]RLG68200.1 MAG: hypothetical protein DRN93_03205 [archaeon]HDN17927.1 hypothetical protein [Candidatus Bathyarchaeota archaeon]